jgi:hypothetical protein
MDNKATVDPILVEGYSKPQHDEPRVRLHEPVGMSAADLLDEFYYKMATARRHHYSDRIAELENKRNVKTTRVSKAILRKG